jgi:outer membrane protein TolC
MKLSISIALLYFFFGPRLHAQDSAGKILSPDNFIGIVKQFHPVIRQANINIEKAAAGITTARGGFDPSVYLETDQKTFDGKNYYSYVNPELKIPTWYGIEVKAGLENNGGQFLNSETSTGQSSYIGLSVPLAKNLLMDKRRAVLQQAKIFKSQTEAERLNIINDLLYNAYSAYWNWVKEYQVFAILSNAVKINEARFELVKIAYRQGDRPAIDTVEALAQ